MPLMKALGADKSTQLSYPSMWGNSRQQGTSDVSTHDGNGDGESSTLLRGDLGRKDVPKSRQDRLEKDQFHSTLSPYYTNTRDTSPSPGSITSSVGITGQNASGVASPSDIARVPSPQLSPRLRHTSPKRLRSPPRSPSLPTVAPSALTLRKYPQSDSGLTGFWADLAENKFLNTQEFWLILYFFFNLSLTLYNKVVLVHFPYPYTVTALHALCGTVGGWSLLAQGLFVQKRLSYSDNMALVMFSFLYAMNIAISNVSLNLVTVPVSPSFSLSPQLCVTADRFRFCNQFHQVVRAATPIFTIILSSTMFGSKFTTRKVLSLIPVILGVALASVSPSNYPPTHGLMHWLSAGRMGIIISQHGVSFSPSLAPSSPLSKLFLRMFSNQILHPQQHSVIRNRNHFSPHCTWYPLDWLCTP